MALVLVGRGLLEPEGVNANKQHITEGTLCLHKISEEERQIAKGVEEQI